jgi:hypothetical protein
MEQAFPEAEVRDYEPLAAAMPNDEKDRHVAAAALRSGAQVIVTSNLDDFRDLPAGIEAQSPDEFLCNLFDLDPKGIVALLREQAGDLSRPPVSVEELLDRLARVAPDFVAAGSGARGGYGWEERAPAADRHVVFQSGSLPVQGRHRGPCLPPGDEEAHVPRPRSRLRRPEILVRTVRVES